MKTATMWPVLDTSISFHKKMAKPKSIHVLMKIAGIDQVSFGPVPLLMVVKVIWSTAEGTI